MTTSGKGSVFWVPYVETKAVISIGGGGKSWCASEPFSGRIISVGKHSNGQIYAAYIAAQSRSDGPEGWDKYCTENKITTLYESKFLLPSVTFFSCSYGFATFGASGLTSVARVDVTVDTKMGGSDGTIFNVH